MPRLRVLSGSELLNVLGRFGFEPRSQRGSHVKLRRVLPDGSKQSLVIVLHDEVDKGTLRAIYRQVLRYIPESELRREFWSD